MSIDISNLINIFSRFLDHKEVKISKLETIESIRQLPLHSFKFIQKNEAKILKEFLDVSNIESVRDIITEVKPDIIIHAAATKFVDLSEKYPSTG